MSKLKEGKKYHCNIVNDDFIVKKIIEKKGDIFLKFDENHDQYIKEKDGSIGFNLYLIENDLQNGDVYELNDAKYLTNIKKFLKKIFY